MELALLDQAALLAIRNETVFVHYPIHRLDKRGENGILEILERNETETGKRTVRWQVSYNSKYGEPGLLAYKIDTIIINRAIEDARERGLVPALIKLGSLSEIARELGTGDNNTSAVKKALYQNAFAAIVTKQTYTDREGKKTNLEFAGTRYGLIFAGQEMPDGCKADAVYIRLQEDFRALLNSARTRPLDYDYLKKLKPSPQRLYELLSFEIYAALKRQSGRARLLYSEYCLHAPQKRYYQGNLMRMQMKALHAPHIASGYITDDVEYTETTDSNGKIDWEILYMPGRKALVEYVQFNTKGGRQLEAQATREKSSPPAPPEPALPEPQPLALPELQEEEPSPDPKREALAQELIKHGLAPHRAQEAAREKEAAVLHQALRHFQYKRDRGDKIRDAGALLADMIARPQKYVLPEAMPDPQKAAAKKAARQAAKETEAARIAGVGERLRVLHTQMEQEQPEAFAAFRRHCEAERAKFERSSLFKSRTPNLQRILLASYDTEKGRLQHFCDYFRSHDCALPDLSALLQNTPQAELKRILDALSEKP